MGKNVSLIDEIVSMEWDMFIDVNKGMAVAECQEDNLTFSGMREAQFQVWSDDVQESYLNDLRKAKLKNRNLIAEKYIHMMRTTAPIDYLSLLATVDSPSESVSKIANEINKKLMDQTKTLHEIYPYTTSMGRPLYSINDDAQTTSIETYQLGELLTYSEQTLILLSNHVNEMNKNGISYAKEVLENTINYWGYSCLEIAETTIKKQFESV